MIFSSFSGSLRLFLVFPCCICICNPLRVSSWPLTLILSLKAKHEDWASVPSPTLCGRPVSKWATFWLGSAAWHDLCGELFVLPSEFPLLHCLLKFRNSPLILPVRSFWVCRKLSSSRFLPRLGPHPEILCLHFCLYLLPHLILREIGFAFLEGWGPLPVFHKIFYGSCSTYRWFLYIFVGGEVISPSYYSSTNLNLHPPKSVPFKWKLNYGSFFFPFGLQYTKFIVIIVWSF